MSSKLIPSFPTRILNPSRGLSLIELLAALSIISILLFGGLPSFTELLKKIHIKTATQNLLTAIHTTRALSVIEHKRAVLKANTNWHEGWELFIDDNDNGVRDHNEQLVLIQEAFKNISISSNRMMKTISFISTGESRRPNGQFQSGAFLAGSITICAELKEGYRLILARGGRVRLISVSCY